MSGAEYGKGKSRRPFSFFCHLCGKRKNQLTRFTEVFKGISVTRYMRYYRCGAERGVFARGFRGGNWNNDSSNARVSDRNNAANTNTNRNNNNGLRCVKTSLAHNYIIERRERNYEKAQ
jgi:hypothetical protein